MLALAVNAEHIKVRAIAECVDRSISTHRTESLGRASHIGCVRDAYTKLRRRYQHQVQLITCERVRWSANVSGDVAGANVSQINSPQSV